MAFYIAPYRCFSYIQALLQVFSLYKTLSFLLYLAQTVVFCLYIIETLIIGVFLYIEETLFFLLYFAPEMCIFYIQCFPYSKNNTFLSIHFFFLLYFAQIVVYVFLIYMEIRHFPRKICVLLYIQKKDAFFLYIFSICVFSLYTQEYLFLFLQLSPAHSISV